MSRSRYSHWRRFSCQHTMTSHTFRNCSSIIDIDDDSVQVLVISVYASALVLRLSILQFLSWSSRQLLVRYDSATSCTQTNANRFVSSNFNILGSYIAAVAAAADTFMSLEPSRWRCIDTPGHLQTTSAYTRQQVIIYEWLKLSLRMFQNPLSDIKVALCSLCSCRRRSLCITDTWTRFVE